MGEVEGQEAQTAKSPRWEWIAAGALSALVVALHAVRLFFAGALWRDEAAAARLAQLPTLGEIRGLFQHEAFPLLFPCTVRVYTLLFGNGDLAFRAFGFAVGLGIVSILWWNARSTARTVPLLSLALLGLDLPFLVYGDSLRGYGLGSAFLLLTYGLLARALAAPPAPHPAERGRAKRLAPLAPFVPAALAAIASVQVLLSNASLVGALCAAAALVAVRRRRHRRVGQAVGIGACGALAALSLLPYAGSLAAARRQWSFIVVYPVGPSRLFHEFASTLGPLVVRLIWLGLVGVGLWAVARRSEQEDRTLFAALTIPCVLVSNGVFLSILSYTPRPWYFLPLLALLASALDTLFAGLARSADGSWRRSWPLRSLPPARLRVAAVVVLLAAQAVPLAQSATLRQTNVDRVARQVASAAAPGDLVVVDPWYFGVSFNRYYRGTARWVTLPDLPDHRIHRYDLLKVRMAARHPIDDVLAAVAATLRSRHRVWLVGGYKALRPNDDLSFLQPLPELPPAPHSPDGWHDRPYTLAWSRELTVFLELHAARLEPMAIPAGERANPLEDLPLTVAGGWQERMAAAVRLNPRRAG
jgi:hypothetical protein